MKRMEKILLARQLDGILVSSSANMRSSVGFRGEGIVFVSRNGPLVFTDSRYTIAAKEECPEADVIQYKKNIYESWLTELLERLGREAVVGMSIGFEDETMTVQTYQTIHALLKKHELENMTLVPLHKQLDQLRQVKTEQELLDIEKAEQIGDSAFARIVDKIRDSRSQGVNITEKQVAAYLEFYMKEMGAEGTSFDTIAASGIHSSMPHAIPTDKVLEEGDFLTMDFGCRVNGYCSDMTRTVVVGKANDRQKEVYELEKRMVEDSLAVMKAGVKGGDIYDASIRAIQDTPYFPYHYGGIGHGIGLFVHELPFIRKDAPDVYEENIVTTIEPGLYIPGWGGVRIEDQVIIRDGGCENLISVPHDLMEL